MEMSTKRGFTNAGSRGWGAGQKTSLSGPSVFLASLPVQLYLALWYSAFLPVSKLSQNTGDPTTFFPSVLGCSLFSSYGQFPLAIYWGLVPSTTESFPWSHSPPLDSIPLFCPILLENSPRVIICVQCVLSHQSSEEFCCRHTTEIVCQGLPTLKALHPYYIRQC